MATRALVGDVQPTPQALRASGLDSRSRAAGAGCLWMPEGDKGKSRAVTPWPCRRCSTRRESRRHARLPRACASSRVQITFWTPSVQAHLEGGQLVEVGREERGAADLAHQVLRDGPGQAKAVVGGRAPAQLVDDDQRALARALRGAQHSGTPPFQQTSLLRSSIMHSPLAPCSAQTAVTHVGGQPALARALHGAQDSGVRLWDALCQNCVQQMAPEHLLHAA